MRLLRSGGVFVGAKLPPEIRKALGAVVERKGHRESVAASLTASVTLAGVGVSEIVLDSNNAVVVVAAASDAKSGGVVLTANTLFCDPRHAELLARCRDALAPGGALLFDVYNAAPLVERAVPSVRGPRPHLPPPWTV